MNKLLKRLSCLLTLIVPALFVQAQAAAPDDNVMKSNGKIYVVMLVVIVIVTGLLLCVINVDRKVSRLEKGNKLTIDN